MSNHHETLEDLLCYLECARDNLLVIQCAIEEGRINERITLNVLFGSYNHLDFIAKEMQRHIEHIPSDVLRKVAEEVAQAQDSSLTAPCGNTGTV